MNSTKSTKSIRQTMKVMETQKYNEIFEYRMLFLFTAEKNKKNRLKLSSLDDRNQYALVINTIDVTNHNKLSTATTHIQM